MSAAREPTGRRPVLPGTPLRPARPGAGALAARAAALVATVALAAARQSNPLHPVGIVTAVVAVAFVAGGATLAVRRPDAWACFWFGHRVGPGGKRRRVKGGGGQRWHSGRLSS